MTRVKFRYQNPVILPLGFRILFFSLTLYRDRDRDRDRERAREREREIEIEIETETEIELSSRQDSRGVLDDDGLQFGALCWGSPGA